MNHFTFVLTSMPGGECGPHIGWWLGGGSPDSGALRKAGLTKRDGGVQNLGILQQRAGPSLQWPT